MRFGGFGVSALALVVSGAGAMAAPDPVFDTGPAAHDLHIARALAGVPEPAQAGIRRLCDDPQPNGMGPVTTPPPGDSPETRVPPMQVFDQLYFVGDKDVSVWALKTSAGLILFDAGFASLTEARLLPNLRAVGLRPQDIRYVVVTHAHADHYGGARALQRTNHARVLMGAADWNARYDPRAKGYDAPLPRRDIAVDHERTLTLGDTTVRLIPTPGHTPGTLSALIPVTDHGQPHLVSLWGGGFPNEGGVAQMKTYALTAAAYRETVVAAKADVAISNHPTNDESLGKMKQLAARAPDRPNPFVTGTFMVAKRLQVAEECTRAWIAAHPD